MINWSATMTRTFEYYIVDPGTWKDTTQLKNVKSCSINRDDYSETLGSATIDVTDTLGECYIRVYMVVIQNGLKERVPLGTFLVQTPSSAFDGMMRTVTMDAYTPLIELKEKLPPIGYSLLEGENIMNIAYSLARENARAPVVSPTCEEKLYYDFVSNTADTWLTFLSDLIANANYTFDLDEMGRILFSPKQDITALQPVWTYDDDNSSILYPEINMDHDLYDVPNVLEVVHTKGSQCHYVKIVNDDPNSPVSTVNRGREVPRRITNPDLGGDDPTKTQIDEYAKRVLKELSTVEYTISYSHGYCPVRVGDCVRLNYAKAGLTNVKAKVISQSIQCKSECKVQEKAVYTEQLWG